jgi:hypothetical protein
MANADRQAMFRRARLSGGRFLFSQLVGTADPCLITSLMVEAGEVKLRDGTITGTVLAHVLAPAGATRQVVPPRGWFCLEGAFLEVLSGQATITGTPDLAALGEEPETGQKTSDTIILLDPLFAPNLHSDNTEITTIDDESVNANDLDWTAGGYLDNLWYRTGALGPDAPNSNPYWERFDTHNPSFHPRFPSGMMTGVTDSEVWMVIAADEDPQLVAANSGGPIHLAATTDIPIYPTTDLGAATRDIWITFGHAGPTGRMNVSDAELVFQGYDAPSLDAWHIARFKWVEATKQLRFYLDGTLIDAVTLAAGVAWQTQGYFWGTSLPRTWAGRMAYLQIFNANLTPTEDTNMLTFLQNRFGL